MRTTLFTVALIAVLNISSAFFAGPARVSTRQTGLSSTVEEEKTITSITAPDFYWQYRLGRLVEKKGSDLGFEASNYPDVSGDKDMYDAYYLDLTLQGKMDGFDWREEKNINDAEWQQIYKSMCAWSKTGFFCSLTLGIT